MPPLNSRGTAQNVAKRDTSSNTTRSSSPSSSRADGAMRAPLPNCGELATVTSSARRPLHPGWPRQGRRSRSGTSPAGRSTARARRRGRRSRDPRCGRPRSNRAATWASKPTPATLKNSRPPNSPASITRGARERFGEGAPPAGAATPSSRASPLPEPAGTSASGRGCRASADADLVHRAVAAPDDQQARRARSAPAASSRAWPRRSETRTSRFFARRASAPTARDPRDAPRVAQPRAARDGIDDERDHGYQRNLESELGTRNAVATHRRFRFQILIPNCD